MRTLALLALTAAAAISVPAIAQAQPAPRAGHSWGQPGRQAQRVVVREVVGRQPGMREVRQVGQARQFQRIGRGQVVPTFWAAPQFQVRSWQAYGFPQPMQGMRWIRYYDDALLVDRGGRVHDGRYDYDWDSYGERWSRDDRGIPMYAGNGDYHPGDRDYAWADEADEGGWDYAEYGDEGGDCGRCDGGDGHGRGGYAREGHGRDGYARDEGYARGGGYRREGYRHGGGYEQGGYSSGYSTGGYGGGYAGYGYGYGGGTVTITETTVETGGSQVIEETVYEEVIETRARAHRAAPRRAAPVRRPIRGERG